MLKDDRDCCYPFTFCESISIIICVFQCFTCILKSLYLDQIIEEGGEETSPEKTDGEDSTVIKKGICLNAEAGAL